MFSRRALLGGLAAAGSLAASGASAKLFSVDKRRVETFTLANGLQVVVLPSSRAPIVNHLLVYKVGGADEVFGKTGIAHLLKASTPQPRAAGRIVPDAPALLAALRDEARVL